MDWPVPVLTAMGARSLLQLDDVEVEVRRHVLHVPHVHGWRSPAVPGRQHAKASALRGLQGTAPLSALAFNGGAIRASHCSLVGFESVSSTAVQLASRADC